jgi:hypothetical protein
MIKDTNVYKEIKKYCDKCDYETNQRSYEAGNFCSNCNRFTEEYDLAKESEHKNERLAFKISIIIFVLGGCVLLFGLFSFIKYLYGIWS